MPDPARLIRRSVQHARDKGLSHGQAVWRIIGVIRSCRRWLDPLDPELASWWDELETAAWAASRSRRSPATSRQEN